MNSYDYSIRILSREQAIAVYRDISPAHFPEDELKPVAAIETLYNRNAYLGLGLYQNETEALVGYALFLTPPEQDTVLLDYYAILEDYRESGLGSFFLQGMNTFFRNKAGILIETEDPSFSQNEEEALQRNRRNAFYHKNGALQTGVACTLFGVPFQIHFMPTTNPETDSASHVSDRWDSLFFRKSMEQTYRFMLPEPIYLQNVIWR